jgi:hypothetical protein
MRCSRLVVVLTSLIACTSGAEEARTTIGVLTCTLADGPTERGRRMTCGFKPTGTSADEKYNGTLQRLGQSEVGKQVLVWAVVGPANAKHPAGFLAQRYLKAKGAEGQPPSWIGEANSAIVLQFESHGDAALAKSIDQVDLKLGGSSA